MYSIYVIELSKQVYSDLKRFRDANPQYNGVLECLYVGMTSKRPEERFKQHVKGVLSKRGRDISSRVVKKYGLYLRPNLYKGWTARTRSEALKMEKKLSLELKRKRYAVWSN